MGARPTIVVNLHMTVDTVAQMMTALKALDDRELLVGFPSDDDRRGDATGTDHREGAEEDGINNATLGAIMNGGSPANNIPPSDFMESGLHTADDKIIKALGRAGTAAMDGDLAAIDKGFNAAGLVAVSGIKSKITEGPWQKLAESTLAARRRRGVTRTNRLTDTGQMRNAVNYVIRPRGDR